MRFELKDYHKNVSNEELINDVTKTAKRLGLSSLTVNVYSQNGAFHPSTLIRRFGGWKEVLTLSHLEIERNQRFRINVSGADIVKDVIRVKNVYGKDTITRKEYDVYGIYHSSTLIKHGMSWNKILKMSGLKLNENRDISTKSLLEEIERLWIKLGRQPTATDIRNRESIYSLNTFIRHFGGWRNALIAFIKYVNKEDEQEPAAGEQEPAVTEIPINPSLPKSALIVQNVATDDTKKHKTPREPNLRLRFKVFLRDKFRCCSCGASPAKDPGVELHVDHIFPWSKGGETVFENLQTLCSKCNGGKSNLT